MTEKSNKRLKDCLSDFFREEKIEYFRVIPYSLTREINRGLIEREGFTPRSVIIFLLPYYAGGGENLSAYSSSLDYHIAIRDITDRLISRLSPMCPSSVFKGYGDHSPIDERHAALISGLGLLGDNGLLINETYGSYVFIADVLTDVSPEDLGARHITGEVKFCHRCGLCKAACPTGILRGEGGDCLSAVTQRKGELTESEVALMRSVNTVWGCDECQTVCPYNLNPKPTPIEFFHKERIPLLTSSRLAEMDKESFKKRAFAWRGRKTVERNLEKLGY